MTFLGPSGCGKTTTLRLIAGFLQPDTGEVRSKGQVLSTPKFAIPPEERHMGMVFQNYAIWPHMSVFENVAFGLNLKRTDKRTLASRVEAILDTVGLSGLWKSPSRPNCPVVSSNALPWPGRLWWSLRFFFSTSRFPTSMQSFEATYAVGT